MTEPSPSAVPVAVPEPLPPPPPPPRPQAPAAASADHGVPPGLVAAAGWTWRLLLVGGGIYALLRLLAVFQVLVVPVLVALLVVALLKPVVDVLSSRLGVPRGLAALLTIVLAIALLAGLFTLIGQEVAEGFPDLQRQAQGGLDQLRRYLADSPLHLTGDQLSALVDRATASVRADSGKLVSGALVVTNTAGHLVAGFFIVLFSSYFFLAGGEGIWRWVLGLLPVAAREPADGAARKGWTTLTSFVRATLLVAFTDGLGVTVVASVLGVPLALPLGVLVFLGAFVPIVGALVSGSVAVLVALVAEGPVAALLMLAGVVAVQQLESHVLQPFLMGRAVRVHPLAVILVIAAGVLVAGIVGALFAVPITAVANVAVEHLRGLDREPGPDAAAPDGPDPGAPLPGAPVADPAAG